MSLLRRQRSSSLQSTWPPPPLALSHKHLCRLTFFGRRRVTRVMPWMRVKCSFSMALRAFFSLREWMTAVEPAGRLESPASISESELSSSSCSSTVTFLGSSSGSSSILGFAIFRGVCLVGRKIAGQPSCLELTCDELPAKPLPQNCSQTPQSCEPPKRYFRGVPGSGDVAVLLLIWENNEFQRFLNLPTAVKPPKGPVGEM